MNKSFFSGCITFIVTLILFILLYGTIVMLLWNWLMPILFGLTTITWVQALGIYFLAHILFAANTTINNNKD